ncbi:MAG TPA: hypothetical protein VJZ71_07825 [Phycisphaerae bacterium]|nr:hypothetical protein [Phycisphaerae bacterium]
MSVNSERNNQRLQWLAALDSETRFVLLTGPWSPSDPESHETFALLNEIVVKYRQGGVRWIVICSDVNERNAALFLRKNPINAYYVSDPYFREESGARNSSNFILDKDGSFVHVNVGNNELAGQFETLCSGN